MPLFSRQRVSPRSPNFREEIPKKGVRWWPLITILLLAFCFLINPARSRSALPEITHGPLSGEVTFNSVVLWARGNGPGTLLFEVAEQPNFNTIRHRAAVEVREGSDYTGKVAIEGLSPARKYYYRVSCRSNGQESTGLVGQFSTAPVSQEKAAFRLLFGTCLGGQGQCRDPRGGWKVFNAMEKLRPDFFLMLGDGIYADGTCPSEEGQNMPGAETVAENLAGFRRRYQYHLEDVPYGNFLARTPVYVTWDDHEIRDNFGGPALSSLNSQLFYEGRQAFFEYWPLSGPAEEPYRIYRTFSYGAHAAFIMLDTRSYRDPNVSWDPDPRTGAPKTMLGQSQLDWLKEVLSQSTATWKFILTSVPLSIPTGGPQPQVEGRDGWADGGDRSGYETELLSILFFCAAHDLRNIIFLTGDTHFPFAVSYDPDRDGRADFYEFGASPLHAWEASPGAPDQSFHPTVLFAGGPFANFGMIDVSQLGDLTFRTMDDTGKEHYSVTLQPQ